MAVLDPKHATRPRVTAPLPEEVDVAIIGAGTGGLTAGAYLAQQGFKVAVFDRHYVAGGCATQFARGSGPDRYIFDIGLHYVGDCASDGLIPRILRGVGVDVPFLEMDPDGFDRLVFPDLEFRVPADRERYRDKLVELFPAEVKGIDRYCRLISEVDVMGRKTVEQRGRPGLKLAATALRHGRLVARTQNATIGQFLDTCTDDPLLRAVMLGQNGDYGLPPSEVSAILHAGLVNHYLLGAYYPEGGGQVISDRLAETIESNGGAVCLSRGIEEILVEDGRAVGVRTEPRKQVRHDVRAKVVVSNADLKVTLRELLPNEALTGHWKKRLGSFQMAEAIFMTFLGVTADMREKGMGNHNVWQFDRTDFDGMYLDARTRDTVKPEGCYITSASLKDPSSAGHAPEGVTSVEIMTLVPGSLEKWGVSREAYQNNTYRRDPDYMALKQRIEDGLVDRLEDLFPGTRETIVFRESASPVTHSRYTSASEGTGYGLACTPDQFMQNRPGYRGPVDGLYLCGASQRAGHGILGAMLSGRNAAVRVSEDLGRPIGLIGS